MNVEYPAKLAPLLQPGELKGAYGGRGGGKSHFYGENIILRALTQPLRWACIREVQNSIKDSVRQLLIDKIVKFGLGSEFDINETEIKGRRNDSLIIFKGMQSYNAENIKSLEGFDGAWVEEAQTLSAKSLRLLLPTIRKENCLRYGDEWLDSEIWFSWNPRHRTDAVDMLFRKHPPPGAVSVMINWRDNPWFPEKLKRQMLHDKAVDPVQAEHVWEGGYGVDEGAIIARLVDEAEREGRLSDVRYDPSGSDIEISSDIGFRDTASWWFWQRFQNGYTLIGYDEDSGLDAEEWIERLKQELILSDLPLGKIWLPHDAKAKTFQSRFTVIEQFLTEFGPKKVGMVPRTSKTDRINAARRVIRTCEFNEKKCERGLDGLRAWVYKWDPEKQVFSREPDHNWASHPSDGFSYGCQVMEGQPLPEQDKESARFFPEVTADEVFFPEPKTPRSEWI